ncbi:DUF4256 domain-containing protein [Flavobacterium amnicola]|uniref:DUF4256 domain-containing protein n=1 Tax=Flavobacterium amnicola TaxID=2506422 RepID=A0A4Q1K3M0_9FLAO|nr:DUF4256 domain-containing protein [Flavobacterium amnicola]RXR19172.1 DUF4256 domain-containing protein [Flavobacterium amnicola]
MESEKALSPEEYSTLLNILKIRFEKNRNRHQDILWNDVQSKLESHSEKIWSLNEMEKTGGEPDVVGYDAKTNEYIFFDCSIESPKERRSYCYDRKALDARKAHKPQNNVMDVATAMGITLLTETEYRYLQQLGNFDTKTSSWIETPSEIRQLGGALFADFRYNTVFIYHNGADSYYAARGFRGVLRI